MAQDDANYKRIAVLDAFMSHELDYKAQGFVELWDVDTPIDYVIPSRNIFKFVETPNRAGNTILHIARELNEFEICEMLIEAGANFTTKNNDGLPLLHLKPDEENNRYFYFKTGQLTAYEQFMDTVLQAHIQFDNTTNPKDNNGISHFHISCMHNKVELVKRFLLSGVSANETVNEDSPIYAGCTPLHFAVKYCAIETVDLLLEYGADTHIKNSKGLNPLNLLIDEKLNTWIQMVRRLRTKADPVVTYYSNLETFHTKIERIITKLLEKDDNCAFGPYDDTGLSYFHIICTMQDSLIVQQHLDKHHVDLEQAVNSSSALWPGYTALHFAAHFNVDTVKLLLARGANLGARDAKGLTPFDICLRGMKVEDTCSIYSLYPAWANIHFSDGKTKLFDFIQALRCPETLDDFMKANVDIVNAFVPFDSPICAGYTPLHLIVACTEMPRSYSPEYVDCYIADGGTPAFQTYATKIMAFGALEACNVYAKDARGSTPLHLGFNVQEYMSGFAFLPRRHETIIPNVVDEQGLSILHIYCATYHHLDAVYRLLEDGANVNEATRSRYVWHVISSDPLESMMIFPEGSTPLHMAVAVRSPELIQLLVDFGADVLAKDAEGLTPLERWLGKSIFEKRGKPVWKINTSETITELQTLELLLRRASESIADTMTSMLGPMLYCYSLLKYNTLYQLMDHEPTARIFTSAAGITMLHVACIAKNLQLVEAQLMSGVDVNARVNPTSPLWPGYTPMHVLVRYRDTYGWGRGGNGGKEIAIAKLLLERGADVAAKDALDNTPIHLIFQYHFFSADSSRYINALLGRVEDFSSNPANFRGITHLHAACVANNEHVVEQLLEHGAEVDQAVDYFDREFGGWTALHFAAAQQSAEAVKVLLSHGADVRWLSVLRETPLHAFADRESRTLCPNLFRSLISAGADVNVRNIFGDRPLEKLMKSEAPTSKDVRLFVEAGCPVNAWNPTNEEGCLAIALKKTNETTPIFKTMLEAFDIASIDETGRNAIHNIVSFVRSYGEEDLERRLNFLFPSIEHYTMAIGTLTKLDLNIDHQDHEGKTPLHIAAQMRNVTGICGLLRNGANANIVDDSGQTPFAYSLKIAKRRNRVGELDRKILTIISVHQLKLRIIRNELSESNIALLKDIVKIVPLENTWHHGLREELQQMKSRRIGSYAITLINFLSNTGAVSLYPSMSPEKREAIDDIFKNKSTKLMEDFPHLADLLIMQYRKAAARVHLVEPAGASFNFLVGFDMPDVCLRIILRFLSNDDLNNLIQSADVS